MAETRQRRTASAKSEQTEAEATEAAARKAEADAKKAEKDAEREAAKAKREAERMEREEKRAAEKAERDEKKEQEKAAKEKERNEAKLAKEQEKAAKFQEQIDSGDLIFSDFDRNITEAAEVTSNGDWEGYTYTVAEPKKEEVAQRALSVITDLQEKATEVPFPGKELAEEYGGGTVQWVAFFGMLRVLGLVKAYRFKTGERGQSGLAYLWIGPDEPYTLAAVGEMVDEDVEEPAAA